jgi:hypothetical protein
MRDVDVSTGWENSHDHVVYVKVEIGSAHVVALAVASNAFHPMHMHTFHPSLPLSRRYSLMFTDTCSKRTVRACRRAQLRRGEKPPACLGENHRHPVTPTRPLRAGLARSCQGAGSAAGQRRAGVTAPQMMQWRSSEMHPGYSAIGARDCLCRGLLQASSIHRPFYGRVPHRRLSMR